MKQRRVKAQLAQYTQSQQGRRSQTQQQHALMIGPSSTISHSAAPIPAKVHHSLLGSHTSACWALAPVAGQRTSARWTADALDSSHKLRLFLTFFDTNLIVNGCLASNCRIQHQDPSRKHLIVGQALLGLSSNAPHACCKLLTLEAVA